MVPKVTIFSGDISDVESEVYCPAFNLILKKCLNLLIPGFEIIRNNLSSESKHSFKF